MGRMPREAVEAEVAALEQFAESLPCQRPVRMMKHGCDGATGEVSDSGEPVWLRCNTREISKCPPCAALYRGDTRAIIFEGLRTAIDAGEQLIFLTLTAPSFGRTHRVPPTPSPRLTRRQRSAWERRYGRRCPCGRTHSPGDARWIGAPLDDESYGHSEQVIWNAEAGRLWSRTADELTRVLGLESRLPYIAVAEWQARGAIHLHVVLRIPAECDVGIGVDAAHAEHARLIERTVRGVATYTGPFRTGERVTWGEQVVAEPVGTERKAYRTAGYVAKLVGYAVKDLGWQHDSGSNNALGMHHFRLTAAAGRMACPSHPERGRCRSLRHRQWGWRGHIVRRSRTWSSLTMGECRRRRAEFGRLLRDDDQDDSVVVWMRPSDGLPMQVQEHAWPRIRDGRLAQLRTALLTT